MSSIHFYNQTVDSSNGTSNTNIINDAFIAAYYVYSNQKTEARLATKVDRVEGKSLVEDSEIARLLTLENYDDSIIKSLISALESSKASIEYVDSRLSSIYRLKNTIDSEEDLPAEGNEVGDCYKLNGGGTYCYFGETLGFKNLGTEIDMSKFLKIADAMILLAGKVDKQDGKSLVSNEKIAQIHKHNNEEVLANLNIDEAGNLTFNGSRVGNSSPDSGSLIDMSLLLTKEEYASTENKGYVKNADKAKSLEGSELAQPLMYLGTDAYGNYGHHFFPVKSNEETKNTVEQRVILNPVINNIYAIDSENDLSECRLYLQPYRFITGEQDVVSTLKEFNNGEASSFYCDTANIVFNNGCFIKNDFELGWEDKSEDGVFETEYIEKSNFIEFELCE